jgi:putative ABC transport system permease protein
MSSTIAKVVAGGCFAGVAAMLSLRFRLGLARDIGLAALRAGVQLAAVGAAIALVFRYPALAFAFVAVMLLTAGMTAGGRLRGLPGARGRALVAIAVPALGATGALLLVGAFDATARSGVPTAGILIGGAMVATTLTGRRLLESLLDEAGEIEARLCLGDDARAALAPAVRRAVTTGLIPVVDQTRSVGLVTLPGTFVGLILGGATPAQAAATQLVVLLALLAVELAAGLLLAELTQRAMILPGERIALLAIDR